MVFMAVSLSFKLAAVKANVLSDLHDSSLYAKDETALCNF